MMRQSGANAEASVSTRSPSLVESPLFKKDFAIAPTPATAAAPPLLVASPVRLEAVWVALPSKLEAVSDAVPAALFSRLDGLDPILSVGAAMPFMPPDRFVAAAAAAAEKAPGLAISWAAGTRIASDLAIRS